jgi:hypothetical protein
MSEAGRAGSHAPPGGFFPAFCDELRRLAAARLSGSEGFTRPEMALPTDAVGVNPPRLRILCRVRARNTHCLVSPLSCDAWP